MSDSSDDDCKLTSLEFKGRVSNAELNFLLEKSREKYLKAYELFNDWRLGKGAEDYSESIMLSYFMELSKTRQPTTLWSIYSMLKTTIKTKCDVHIETYPKLMAFLKRESEGHKSKQSKIFTAQNIEKFINEAPDCKYLATKVGLIIGISGACRSSELLNLTVNNIEKHSEKLLLVNMPNTRAKFSRCFVICEEYVNIVEKYKALRPANIKTDRFFLQYRDEKCSRQPMGINKIGGLPREIATYLKLQEPQLYTGHCFRRTSAILLADSGADLTTLKRHKECKSKSANNYREDSYKSKPKISKYIIETVNAKQENPLSSPSTSKEKGNERCFVETINIKQENPSSNSTSNKIETEKDFFETINVKQENPWSSPSASKEREAESRSVSPASSTKSTRQESDLSHSPVTNFKITVPNTTVIFNLQNCSNFTFNF